MNRNIIRQIVDIQAQAERLIKTQADMVEIGQFAQYNDEIKEYLISNIDDGFILKYVREIPDLNIEEVETKTGLIAIIIILISSFFGGVALYNEKRRSQKALNTIRDIKGKYASAEFMLKNYFAG
ncbi:hypothetical protein [Flavivirga spongiicola]|uniref:Uncharacterized protein n=1 Tax=Flavivirga spongiicola TaxID=421621 RepID=A0ABU7XSF7_9FLAO|nr:hypothetical protein [Flavivirga sp. MEBiC05379]MDO5978715.1 hypothetical protein [Flavivirga sp. MEBiC05379]